jgi:DNA-binding beta-propeller fold protein YncE
MPERVCGQAHSHHRLAKHREITINKLRRPVLRSNIRLTIKIFFLATLALSVVGGHTGTWAHNPTERKGPYEAWILDQSDTTTDGGGTLYIYQGDALEGENPAGAVPEVIDLGGAARDWCLAESGTTPRRPHMLFFNKEHTHAIISFVATGHVLFIDAASRLPVGCLDVGEQAHAAIPSPDDQYLIVANQNGKLLQRIRTDYETNTFTLENDATLNLATCTTPNGLPCQDAVLRPDNAPICPDFDEEGRFVFTTLRGGGMFVVDSTATPMAIVGEYDRATIHGNGCGGIHLDGKMYINAGGGTAANPLESDLYSFPLSAFSSTPNLPNTPAPTVIFSHDDRGFVDSHGLVLTKHDRYLWVADRAANRLVVVERESNTVINEIDLVGAVSPDPTPDLLEISPNGTRVFMALRGPNPLTANVAGVNNAVGSTPGLGIVKVKGGGKNGTLKAVVPITHVVAGVERADPHGLAIRVK